MLIYCVFVEFRPVIPDIADIIINKGAVPRDSGQISLEVIVVGPLHTARFNKSSFRSWQTLFSCNIYKVMITDA